MAIDLFVQRGAGSSPGENIVDPLIGSIPVAIQRGRNELDARAQPKRTVEAETVYRAGLRLGQLARFHEITSGESWTAKIAGITHEVTKVGDSVQIATKLRLERPE